MRAQDLGVASQHAPSLGIDARTSRAFGVVVASAGDTPSAEGSDEQPRALPAVEHRRLARPLEQERVWTPDTQAMVAALRVVLDLPRQLPDRGQGGVR